MSDLKKALGKRIKQIRKEKQLTQEKLAELINIEVPSLSNIETGKFAPSIETLQKLSEVLKVEPWEFYHFNGMTDEKMRDVIYAKIENNPTLIKSVYTFIISLES